MALSFQQILIASFLSGLFLFAFINFASEYAAEQGVADPLAGNTLVNVSALTSTLNESRAQANARLNATEQEAPTTQAGQFTLFSVLQVARQYTSNLFTMMNILFSSSYNLGVPNIVLGVIMAILTFVVIFLIWRLIRAGE